MKHKIKGLSQRYLTALGNYLKLGTRGHLQPAMDLGRQAVTFGLKTFELTKIHQRAISNLDVANGSQGQIRRAEFFFIEANTPMVETARAERQADAQLRSKPGNFREFNKESAPTKHRWQRAVVGPKTVADASSNNVKPPGKVLKESLQLQSQLRRLTHRVLVAQEDERMKISHELQDEIAQTLLGLNVRLLLLKQAARSKAKELKNEIASAQRLVVKSATFVRRLASELDNHRPTLIERAISAS